MKCSDRKISAIDAAVQAVVSPHKEHLNRHFNSTTEPDDVDSIGFVRPQPLACTRAVCSLVCVLQSQY